MKHGQVTKILIVEDDQPLNDAYRLILEHEGYDVQVAFNGQEALEIVASSWNPDIILLDLRMPVMDGIGFLKQYQPNSHPESVVVVFSNYDAHKDVDEAYSLGVERYVLKARTGPNDLLHLVQTIIKERALGAA